MASDEVYLWKQLEQQEAFRCRVFSIDRVRLREQSGAREPKEGDFHIIRAPDWVNIVALTPTGQLVLIEQFRVGVDRITLELAGGMLDPGEPPDAAARRELEEETGYVADTWQHIGVVEPNPALQSNRCHTFLATGARPQGTIAFDEHERIKVRLLGWDEALAATSDGRISHALVVAAFLHARLHLEAEGRAGAEPR